MSDPQFMNMAQTMLQNPEMASMLGNIAQRMRFYRLFVRYCTGCTSLIFPAIEKR